MDEQKSGLLMQFTTAAKMAIYSPERMKQFLPMLGSKGGAVQVVQTILAAIEQKKLIPPEIKPLLGVNTYMLLVDMAHAITDQKPDPAIVREVIGHILQALEGEGAAGPQAEAMPQAEAAPQDGAVPAGGMVGNEMMGA